MIEQFNCTELSTNVDATIWNHFEFNYTSWNSNIQTTAVCLFSVYMSYAYYFMWQNYVNFRSTYIHLKML